MVLTREDGGAGHRGMFCLGMSLAAMTLAALVLVAPAWSQEEKAAAPLAPAAPAAAPQAETATQDKTAAKEAKEPGLLWMPEAISTYGEGVDWLFWLIFWITGIAWVIVMGLMLYFLIRYRHREGCEKAHYTHGNNKLEVSWTLATIAILVFIGVIQLWGESGWFNIKTAYPAMGKDNKTFVVRVFAEQFAWNFNYPGKDGKFGKQLHTYIEAGTNPIGLVKEGDGADDKIMVGRLVVPEDTDVLLQLTSIGKFRINLEPADPKRYTHPVLHSFFSPHLRLKQDLIPYHPNQLWFKVKPGYAGRKFEIVCAELCGEGHSGMRADFLILNEEDLAKELGYDWTSAVPEEFPEVIHYYQEKKEEEEE